MCYFELTFALLGKPHEKVKTAIKVLKTAKNPVIDNLQIPQFLNGKDWCMIIYKSVVFFPGADP